MDVLVVERSQIPKATFQRLNEKPSQKYGVYNNSNVDVHKNMGAVVKRPQTFGHMLYSLSIILSSVWKEGRKLIHQQIWNNSAQYYSGND